MNINYKTSDISKEELLKTFKLWNDEEGDIYPLTLKSFYQNVINYKNKSIIIAYDKMNIVGFLILKWFDNIELVDYSNTLFISLFLVSKKYRNKGIGTNLLDFAEKERKNRKLVIGKDIFNFFPGIPTDFDNLTDEWLKRRGFIGDRYTHDLLYSNKKNIPIKNKQIIYKYCDDNMKDELINFLVKNKWNRWALETKLYYEHKTKKDKNAYIVAIDNNKIIAFIRINTYKMNIVGNNVMFQKRFKRLGGIGPLGVDEDYRKQGIGNDIIVTAIKKLQERNIKNIIIDWTGLIEYYKKFGFEVWKSYKYMEKS